MGAVSYEINSPMRFVDPASGQGGQAAEQWIAPAGWLRTFAGIGGDGVCDPGDLWEIDRKDVVACKPFNMVEFLESVVAVHNSRNPGSVVQLADQAALGQWYWDQDLSMGEKPYSVSYDDYDETVVVFFPTKVGTIHEEFTKEEFDQLIAGLSGEDANQFVVMQTVVLEPTPATMLEQTGTVVNMDPTVGNVVTESGSEAYVLTEEQAIRWDMASSIFIFVISVIGAVGLITGIRSWNKRAWTRKAMGRGSRSDKKASNQLVRESAGSGVGADGFGVLCDVNGFALPTVNLMTHAEWLDYLDSQPELKAHFQRQGDYMDAINSRYPTSAMIWYNSIYGSGETVKSDFEIGQDVIKESQQNHRRVLDEIAARLPSARAQALDTKVDSNGTFVVRD